jgi:hypothetical protein
MEMQLHAFLNPALGGSQLSLSRRSYCIPRDSSPSNTRHFRPGRSLAGLDAGLKRKMSCTCHEWSSQIPSCLARKLVATMNRQIQRPSIRALYWAASIVQFAKRSGLSVSHHKAGVKNVCVTFPYVINYNEILNLNDWYLNTSIND